MNKKFLSLLIISILFFSSNYLFAQDKIAFIDLNYVYANSKVGKKITKEVQAKQKIINKEFEEFQKKLDKEKKDLLAQKNVLAAEEYKKKNY